MSTPLPEIRITLEVGYLRFKGTRAQIEDEGLIPAGAQYPRGHDGVSWERDGLEFSLHRGRPDNAKGHRNTWADADCWCVDIMVVGRDWSWHARQRVHAKAEELRAEIYRQSPAGRRAKEEQWKRFFASQRDNAYQAFRAQCVPARRRSARKAVQP